MPYFCRLSGIASKKWWVMNQRSRALRAFSDNNHFKTITLLWTFEYCWHVQGWEQVREQQGERREVSTLHQQVSTYLIPSALAQRISRLSAFRQMTKTTISWHVAWAIVYTLAVLPSVTYIYPLKVIHQLARGRYIILPSLRGFRCLGRMRSVWCKLGQNSWSSSSIRDIASTVDPGAKMGCAPP